VTDKQPDPDEQLKLALSRLAKEEYCYLTTTGRVSGLPHEIEIWFGLNDNTIYHLSGGKDESDWVKNLIKNPQVTVRIAKNTFDGTARIVGEQKEELMARNLLAEKYRQWDAGKRLNAWASSALPVAIDINNLRD
jgi:deazaflavin-dependent oxidoreductase (nitroreductase family)